jgi:predicted nucleic acid-binding protein
MARVRVNKQRFPPQPYRDSLIAATALVHNLTVVTRNTADFQRMAVPILNPWE